MTVTLVTGQPCWEIDNDPWENHHFDAEAQALERAAEEAAEQERRPNPVTLLPRPCVHVRCDCCEYGYGEDEYGAPLHVDPKHLEGATRLEDEMRLVYGRWLCAGCDDGGIGL